MLGLQILAIKRKAVRSAQNALKDEDRLNGASVTELKGKMVKLVSVCDAPSTDCPKSTDILYEQGFLTRLQGRINVMTRIPFLRASPE